MTKKTIERRQFIKQAAIAGAIIRVARYATGGVRGANDRVRVGIIGCGARGQEDLREVLKLPNVDFVAVADVYNRRHAEARQLAPGVKTFTDHRRLLDLKDVDAVIVASPLHCHGRHFLDTVAAGKDLFCEKTMTWSIEEAESCRNAARKSYHVIQIGLQHPSSRPLSAAQHWNQGGMARKVSQAEC